MDNKITVLMPVYNAEKFLAESIDSILNQTFKDFEFLIIDDGSTDGSADLIQSYKDTRIRFVRNEKNIGITATLNKGIEMASAELIARMDADDISLPQRLEKQYNYFQKNPDCALVSCWIRRFNTERTISRISRHKPEYFYYFLLFNTWIKHPTVMYKRSVIKDLGMYCKYHAEDFNLWSRLIRKYKFYNLPEVLLDYRMSETSLGRVVKKDQYEQAHLEQIIENVRYYAGQDFPISVLEAEFLRGVNNNVQLSKSAIKQCFTKLDQITRCVKEYDNVNKQSDSVLEEAAFEKKKMLIQTLGKRYSKTDVIIILARLKYFRLLFYFLQRGLAEKLRRTNQHMVKHNQVKVERLVASGKL